MRNTFGEHRGYLISAPGSTPITNDTILACRAILRSGDIGFGEAYRNQWLDTPDAAAVLRLAIRNETQVERTLA